VMALIAHLMEEKNNFGPHLIVVPNAVLVNWKAELNVWLPGARFCPVVAAGEGRHFTTCGCTFPGATSISAVRPPRLQSTEHPPDNVRIGRFN
jgi:hypothetical protein